MKRGSEKILVQKEVLMNYGKQIIMKNGIEEKDAETTMDVLLYADLRGIDTHGVLRLPLYMNRIKKGLMNNKNNIQTLKSENVAIIDGNNYIGPVAAKLAMEKAIESAKNNTIGMDLVKNNHHYGACAYYSSMAIEHNMIGFTTSNTAPLMAPTGGKERLICRQQHIR